MDHFEQVGTRGYYRPVATVTFEQAVDMAAAAMKHARSIGCAELLVNTLGLTGFPPPSTIARYAMAMKWVESAGATLRVAMVARPDIIDPEKIGVLMAQNRGVSGDAFFDEAEAVRWLDSRRAQ
jgi:hypothetical protein